MGAGDVIAQKLIEKQPKLNIERTAKFVVFGGLYVVYSFPVDYSVR